MSEMISHREVPDAYETKSDTPRVIGEKALESEGFEIPSIDAEPRSSITAGCIVQLEHDKDDLAWYKLLGEGVEDDLDEDIMSVSPTSPLGQRLFGMAVGDTIHWTPPHGPTQAKIVQVITPQ